MKLKNIFLTIAALTLLSACGQTSAPPLAELSPPNSNDILNESTAPHAELQNGTQESPFQVTVAEDLVKIGHGEYTLASCYALKNDLEISDHIPIGTKGFEGVFDGGGHTITIKSLSEISESTGLFSKIGTKGIVQNLSVGGAVSSQKDSVSVGMICGSNSGTILNCTTFGTVSTQGVDVVVGGICGTLVENGSIKNCYSTANITAPQAKVQAGGIVGFVMVGKVQNCYSAGAITSGSYAGGIAGSSNWTIENSLALNSNITGGNNEKVGRISGNHFTGYPQDYGYLERQLKNNAAIEISGITQGKTDDKDGTGITQDALTKAFFEDILHWSFGSDDANPWTWSETTLRPMLYWQ